MTTNQKVTGSTPVRRAISIIRDVAQLGSALDLGSRGHRFKSCHPDHHKKEYGEVAQLARAIGSYPVGREFESHPRYHFSLSASVQIWTLSSVGQSCRPITDWSKVRALQGPPYGGIPKWLKGPVLKTGRSGNRRLGSNPSSSAFFQKLNARKKTYREVEQPGSSSGP